MPARKGDCDKLYFETETPPLTGATYEISQITTYVAPSLLFFGNALEMLPQDDILRIIAKLTSKQIHSAYIDRIFFDTDTDRDGLTRFK